MSNATTRGPSRRPSSPSTTPGGSHDDDAATVPEGLRWTALKEALIAFERSLAASDVQLDYFARLELLDLSQDDGDAITTVLLIADSKMGGAPLTVLNAIV